MPHLPAPHTPPLPQQRQDPLLGRPGTPDQPFQVHLLGDLVVVLQDGTTLDEGCWRTGKTADLLRLLALDAGRPVRTSQLLHRLWPDSDSSHARGSLRTAASHIRKTVRTDCLRRTPGGLVLEGAWVDVQRFEELAREVTRAFDAGDLPRTLSLAHACEALHRDEFHAYDDDADWARAERMRLVQLRCQVLTDGAEAAVRLGLPREAIALAHEVERVDGSVEQVHRTLMRAYADVGEVGRALTTFERYRRQLADELGVDPSAATQDLHLQLLRGAAPPTPTPTRRTP